MHCVNSPISNKYSFALCGIHRSIVGYNPYNLFIVTIHNSKNFTTRRLLIIGHIPMYVVKSVVIQINGHGYGFINCVAGPFLDGNDQWQTLTRGWSSPRKDMVYNIDERKKSAAIR